MMDRPNAMVIGPMKAGTTWLHDYFVSRGDVCLPKGTKETFFFDRRFKKGQSWYLAHFKHHNSLRHFLTMEVASSYFHGPEAPERIREMLGVIPLLVTLRNPVRRSWSHYLHMLRYGYTSAPLQKAVQQYPAIIDASRYAYQLDRWQRVFGQDHLYVLFHEHLSKDADKYAEQICRILGLDFRGLQEENRKRAYESAVAPSATLAAAGRGVANALKDQRLYFIVNFARRLGLSRFFYGISGSGTLPEMSDEDRKWLADILNPEVEKLEYSLGLSLEIWKNT